MFIKYILLALFAFGGGAIVAGGVFTVLIAVGLVPRFAGKTHTAKHIFLYEEMVVLGTIFGSFFSIYGGLCQLGKFMTDTLLFNGFLSQAIGSVLLCVFGFFAGIFVGCLALAIAEMLDTIPIFTRRIHFQKGLGIMVCAIAIGKVIGSLIYFAYGIFIE